MVCIERWGTWEDVDERKKWMKKVKEEDKEVTVDLVEALFTE